MAGKTTASLENISKPAPLWWRKLERAMLMAFIPASVTLIQGFKFADELSATRAQLFISVGLVALIKGVGMILANGQVYVDAPPAEPKPEQP